MFCSARLFWPARDAFRMHVEGNTVQRTADSWRALPEEKRDGIRGDARGSDASDKANGERQKSPHGFLDLLPIVLLHLIDRDDANGPGRLAQLVRAQR